MVFAMSASLSSVVQENKMTRVYLGIGSNIEREKNIRGCICALRERFDNLDISPVYECSPVGFDGENFFNLVVGLDTDQSLEQLTASLKEIEFAFGRTRSQDKFLPRTLDIDLLLFGDNVRHDENFDLPRADILDYAFVLQPLAEIAGGLIHPDLQISIRKLWDNFDKPGQSLTPVNLDLS